MHCHGSSTIALIHIQSGRMPYEGVLMNRAYISHFCDVKGRRERIVDVVRERISSGDIRFHNLRFTHVYVCSENAPLLEGRMSPFGERES